jgi:hypothetical protein
LRTLIGVVIHGLMGWKRDKLCSNPQQGAQCHQGSFLLGRLSESSVWPLVLEKARHGLPDGAAGLRGAGSNERIERVEQVGVGPGPVLLLMLGNEGRRLW